MKSAIFVVDDDSDVSHGIKRTLERSGYDVTVETSSERAVGILLSDAEFDLTLLDLAMPGPDGSQVFAALEHGAPARKDRIVFLTGFAQHASDWLSRTHVEVLEKPVSAVELEGVAARYAVKRCSRGPRPLRAPSRPDLRELEMDNEEVNTGVFNTMMAQASASSRHRPPSTPPGLHEITATGFKFIHERTDALKAQLDANTATTAETRVIVNETKTKLDALFIRIDTIITGAKWFWAVLAAVGTALAAGTAAAWWAVQHFTFHK